MSNKLDDYEVLDLIGCGSFGSCYKVCNKSTNEILVWKVIDYGCLSEEKKQLLVTEVSLLRDLRHPHIVRYFDRIVRTETKQLFILTEYCPGGDLATVIKTCARNRTSLEESFIWRVLYQLSSALQACHSQLSSIVILHRDIKPANVFLDDKGNVKLGDFGLACKLGAGQPGCIETMVGTPFYMSPEVMKGEMYNSKSDVWSLGCLIYELCALKPPFHAQNIKELASKISKGRFERIPYKYSESLQRVLAKLLLVNQEERPSIFEVIHNPSVSTNYQSVPEPVSTFKFSKRSPTNGRAPPPSPADREPEKVSKDTFQNEWLTRLQNLRDREAAIRHRELQVEEKERSLNRREHRLALMERAVRDKMVLAEVYLKRSRENRPCSSGPSHPYRSQEWKEVDESFSADAGDTSIMPTSALLNPALVPKPLSLHTKPESYTTPHERRVHFDNCGEQMFHTSLAKPSFLKTAEAIRSNKAKINSEIAPRMQRKVLHLPGYTGPAITVDVPVSESSDALSNLNNAELFNDHNASSPSVELTVLFDDREELQKATTRIDALNLETGGPVSPHRQKLQYCNRNDVSLPVHPHGLMPGMHSARNIAASFDSLLDAKQTHNNCKMAAFSEKFKNEVCPRSEVLRKNAFGGSTRRRRRSNYKSSPTMLSENKHLDDKSTENVENAKNHALLLFHKENKIKTDLAYSKKKPFCPEKGKENSLNKEHSNRGKAVATSLLSIPSVAAAAASAVVSRSKKSQMPHLR